MTSENIENIIKTSKITGRTTKMTSKITERSTGTRSEKKNDITTENVGLGSKLQA